MQKTLSQIRGQEPKTEANFDVQEARWAFSDSCLDERAEVYVEIEGKQVKVTGFRPETGLFRERHENPRIVLTTD